MIRTKRDLINKLRELSEIQLKRGILYKELSLSIEQRKNEKSLKDWKIFLSEMPILKENFKELKGGLKE